MTQTREEHRNQNPGTRSQLRENKKPKVQKPQSKPTENQIAKMSPQTPDPGDHKAYDLSFGSQGWSEAYPVTDLRRDWTGDGVVGEI